MVHAEARNPGGVLQVSNICTWSGVLSARYARQLAIDTEQVLEDLMLRGSA
jgi:hypothetical protein